MLDPDPYQMNKDPKPSIKVSYNSWQDEDENDLRGAEQQLYDGQWEGRHLNNT
jgi:hypothetical protein